MGSIYMDLEGMDDVQRFFNNRPNIVERREVAIAMQRGGDMIIDAAKKRIHSISGDLAGSLTQTTNVSPTQAKVKVHHGAGGEHDHLVEFGHEPGGWNKSDKYVDPHPYMWPAFEEKKREAYEEMKAAIGNAVTKR